ncbi:DUF1273 domain-containing protein [Peribacillus saganii]|uniref:UPF0398 protein D0469_11975 n=1 Tax=Peribacillus saganii TaxID=2303992 RepID=A0A372LMC9_9BACI|nr:DUF1273 domain-containing protein [Peribacillus saganii]RFU68451.1 DUF1273 domain-containing protein [Peribacillus saganii]
MKVLYLTGYKPFEFGIFKNDHPGVKYIQSAIKQRIALLAEEGVEWVIINGQLGVELWGAEMVLELKEEYSLLRLAVLTPYLNQEESWKEHNREYYESILARADFVDSISKKPYEGPAQLRAKSMFMLQKSDAMLIVYDEERDGSPKYVYKDAKKHCEASGYRVHQITFDDLQQVIEDQVQDDWT